MYTSRTASCSAETSSSVEHRAEPPERVAVALVAQDLELVVAVRVAERRLQEEAVELGLRQREGALVLDRVLGREQRGTASAARASCRRR